MCNEILSFYQSLFQKEGSIEDDLNNLFFNSTAPELADQIEREFSEEVKSAVFMQQNRSLGLDGFPMALFFISFGT